ncbi:MULTISPECIES: hypothetical protein [Flagellimonas]|uniref:Glucosamine inositolphosphorylceramide transferase 1 N-terminal domain-containing protein n=1 Tax=Flagellimonas hadalis TaxID=2597517 RepID=A0A5N5IVU3_9FLAO|nr:hypothetical protein [Allomuricauda hadalis]KAB5491519.1 hypothetical protein FOT42_000810 [Allomuricauda hadalis]
MAANKLKIGILINDYRIPLWEYRMVQNILASDHSEVALIVRKKSMAGTNKDGKLKTLWKVRNSLLYFLHGKLENKLFKPRPNAFQAKDLKELIECPEIVVSPKETKFSDIIGAEDISKIREHNIDVFIRFGFRILRGEILKSSKFGVWSYHHGDNDINRGGPPGVWEVYEGWHNTGAVLQILTEDLDGGLTLAKTRASTDSVSINRNKNNYYWSATSLITRKLAELHKKGGTVFMDEVLRDNAKPQIYYNRLFVAPTNGEALKALLKIYTGVFKGWVKRIFFFNQWILMYSFEKKEQLSKSFFRFKRIVPPKDRFWADPFIFEKDGKYYVFFEELIYKNGLGNISVLELDEKGNYSEPKIVLEKDYHLSYPFLIEDNGNLYMIPETAENKQIELYKCDQLPLKWSLEKVLMKDVQAVDTTIISHENTYWLFCNIKENEGSSTSNELFLFYADNLVTNNWTPHPKNPIVSDVSSSRPAGKIFEYNGHLIRPSQNCAKHYGHGMQLQMIKVLTKEDYQEINLQSIYPNWEKDLVSTHTINQTGKLTVIDALVKRRK